MHGVDSMARKAADLAGPGIGTYEQVDDALPKGYKAVLDNRETQQALFMLKRYIMDNLNRELNLFTVEVPLIVTVESGVNDMLDRDGSRTPVGFPCGLGLEKRMDCQVVQAATKWKRLALRQFGCAVGEGINTDMRAVRKDYFLDHDHSAYVDQWDWEKAITARDRNLDFLRDTVTRIWKVIKGAETMLHSAYPRLAKLGGHPPLPDELAFFHAEEILERFPDLPRKQRETALLQEHPAVFIIGIGSVLADGYPHELRAADYDDWVTPVDDAGKRYHGLNGDILVWNPVTKRRHELSSMGIRVTKETLVEQLRLSGQLDRLELPYHQAIMNDEVPLSIGGGIGQARTTMLLLKKAHLGEVSVSVWPERLKEIGAQHGIHVLE